MQDYAPLFEQQYKKMSDRDLVMEIRKIIKKRISPLAMLATIIIMLQIRR